MTEPLTPESLAELLALAQRANNWGRWARWTDQDGASHMRGLFMVGNLAAVIPIGEMWVETDPDDVNPIAECYTPELADFIAAANPTAVLALLDAAARLAEAEAERDEIAGRLAHLLCDLTGGRLSRTTYPVPVMAQEIEQYLSEWYESDLKDERDALAAKIERVRALHYAADNDAARTPICETCHGEAGVHECGCWADRDREPVCGHCNEGHKGTSVPWPCPTICALDATDTDHAC